MKLFKGIAVLQGEKKDEEWMGLVKENHREAFDVLYHRYKRPIMSYIYSMTLNQDLAEDLTQETFLKLYRSRESYQPTAKFSTFLWTIAKHTTFDHLSKKKELLATDEESLMQEPESEDPGAEELIAKSVDERRVKECLERLTPRAREIVTLRIFSEESYEEISRITQESEGSVKTIIHRSKAKLIECFRRGQ